MLANVLLQEFNKKVAVAEKNRNHDLAFLSFENEEVFSLRGVFYYPDFLCCSNEPLFSGKYDYCLFDFGSSYAENKELLLQCDMKLIVTDCVPWHMENHSFLSGLEQDITGWKNWRLLINHALPGDQQLFRRTPIKTVPLPYSPDPFRVTKQAVKSIRDFFQETAY